MQRKYKVAFWGLGNIGGTVLREALKRPEFEVVAGRVYHPEKNGRDIGELVGVDPVGVLATTDRDAVIASDADCVVHTPQSLDMAQNDADVIELLESGKNVLTTVSYQYPPMVQGPELTQRIEDACRKGQSTLHGTGVHPGFMFERLGMTLTGLFTQVDHIRVVEAFDCLGLLGHGSPKYLRAAGFGTDPSALHSRSPVARWTNQYYEHVIGYAGKQLYGAEPDEIRIDNDARGVAAEEACDLFPAMRIEKGQTLIACLEHRGYLGDHHFFTNEEYWFPGLENRYLGTSGVPFGNFQGTSNYIIEVSGTPMSVSLQLDLASGADDQTPAISYCSAIPILQSIVLVCTAPAGILYPHNTPHFTTDFRLLTH